ncbi:MAG TPA: dienelactone hydrolase family protein [Candidatus Baltobacteraceae bacterium]|nr:dienelactone hydrolase family protein [Candidatus Baltobacteraceae bacterium]
MRGRPLVAALVILFGILPAQTVRGEVVVPPGTRHVPGVVILDPDAGRAGSRGSDMARRLLQAGYATLVVTSDPLAAAALLKRQQAVRGDDVALVGYGDGASSVLATIVERYDLEVDQPPVFRSAIAFGPNCTRRYGDWVGHSLANLGGGTTGAPHGGDTPTPGLFRSATPLLIVATDQKECRDLARDSFVHEYFVTYSNDAAPSVVEAFLAQYAQYTVVSFPSSQAGTTLVGELTLPAGAKSSAAIIISPGTAGVEGFSFWERPWARRLHDLGYASLVVDSYTSRHSSWKNHWRIDARTTRARDLLDAQAYLAKQPYVRAGSIGLIGRSSGGSAIFATIVQEARAPSAPPPFGLDVRPPFSVAVADYGYCQLAYGDWPGGTAAASSDASAYRTSVPLLVQVGANDKTVSAPACEALTNGARDAGSPVELTVYPGVGHRFDAGVVETPPATVRASVERIAAFLKAHLTP